MISAAQRALYEAQALACLEAAERYQGPLVALATSLTGSESEGMELFQQAALNCHDAIQTGGFEGEHYQFYLRRAIKNLHYRTEKEQQRRVPLTFQEPAYLPEEMPSEWHVGAPQIKLHKELQVAPTFEAEQTSLAEQVMAEAQRQFSYADRVALRLSLDGLSCQQIAEHIGMKDQSWVNRRLKRMKDYLRNTFQQSFNNLGE